MTSKFFSKNMEREIRKMQRALKAASPEEKDALLAMLLVYFENLADIVKDLLEEGKGVGARAAEKEIEHILSLGPSWLNYTLRRKKKES